MQEYTAPSNEIFDKKNVVEIKAANFIWDVVPDQIITGDSEKLKRKSSGILSFLCLLKYT